jgi:adenine-specific DNA-methyltransferase
MDKVVDGEQGGISKAVDWHGGGGYHFYELAESLLVQHPVLPIMQVNPHYTFEMLCEAICKIEGFKYTPKGVFHGYSSEKRFIHITKEFINLHAVILNHFTLLCHIFVTSESYPAISIYFAH